MKKKKELSDDRTIPCVVFDDFAIGVGCVGKRFEVFIAIGLDRDDQQMFRFETSEKHIKALAKLLLSIVGFGYVETLNSRSKAKRIQN